MNLGTINVQCKLQIPHNFKHWITNDLTFEEKALYGKGAVNEPLRLENQRQLEVFLSTKLGLASNVLFTVQTNH